jgi:hypothetical protein
VSDIGAPVERALVVPVGFPLARGRLRLGEKFGWRLWKITPAPPRLRSCSTGVIWPVDGQLTAANLSIGGTGQAALPGDYDRIGIVAFKDRTQAIDAFANWIGDEPIAGGSCAVWGEVVIHELGYRAQHARVWTVEGVRGFANQLEELRNAYGV